MNLSKLNIRDLCATLEGPMWSLIERYVRQPYETERFDMLRRCQIADRYYRGNQYKYFAQTNGSWNTVASVDSSQVAALLGLGPDDSLPQILDYVLNFYKGDMDKVMAIVSRMKPACKAQPLFEGIPGIQAKIQTADEGSLYLDRALNFPVEISKMGYSLLKYPGSAYFVVDYVQDSSRYGESDHDEMDTQMVPLEGHYACQSCGAATRQADLQVGEDGQLLDPLCQECGTPLGPDDWQEATEIPVPVVAQTFKVANGAVRIATVNVLTALVPYPAMSLEDAPWAGLEYREWTGRLKTMYPDFADVIHDDSGYTGTAPAQVMGDMVRDQIAAPSGVNWVIGMKGRSPYARYWLDTSMYHHLADVAKGQDLEKAMLDAYPDGVYVAFIGNKLVDVSGRNKMTQWVAAKASESDYLTSTPPVFENYLPICDIVNNTLNMFEQILATSSPTTVASSEVIDFNALNSGILGRSGRQIIPAKAGTRDLRFAFTDLPVSQPNGSAISFIDKLIQWVREITGVNQALFGGGQYNTAREALVARQQALAMLQPLYSAIAKAVSKAKELAILQLAQWGNGYVYFPKSANGKQVKIPMPSLPDLLDGGWVYSTDETIPVDPADRRDQIQELMANPALAPVLGVTHPDNLDQLAEVVAISGWTLPGKNEVDALTAEIEAIVTGVGEPDLMGIVDPGMASEVYRSWLLSSKGRRIKEVDKAAWDRVRDAMGAYGPPPNQGPPPPPNGGSMPEAPPEGSLPPMGPPPGNPNEAAGAAPAPGAGPLPPDGQGLPGMG